MLRLLVPLIAFLFIVFIGVSSGAQEPDAGVTAFVDVNVVSMEDDRSLEHHTVIVRGDRITEIGPADRVEIPEGAQRVDGSGKYLIPGFAEMHGHIPPSDARAEYVQNVLFLYLANGVTTVRGMQGSPGQLELREQANTGSIISPTLYLAGPGFSGNSIDSPAQARQRVREQKVAGWDLLKVLPGLTREEYDAMAEEADRLDIPFAGHIPDDVGLVHAIEMGQDTIDHLDGYIDYLNGESGPLDESRLKEAVELTLEHEVEVVPTMALWETILGSADLSEMRRYPELKYMPQEQVENWIEGYQRRISHPQFDRDQAQQVASNRKQLLKALNEGGVTILFGTDAPQTFSVPGFSIHREIQAMAEAGMTPYQILRSGTVQVGEYFEDKDEFGTVEEGKRADLILLNANPLSDAANISQRAGVMVRGRWLSEQDIQEGLRKIEGGQVLRFAF
ncbi:MAG: amidohydrolase family protein, partial [Acidobacteriota bacterium]